MILNVLNICLSYALLGLFVFYCWLVRVLYTFCSQILYPRTIPSDSSLYIPDISPLMGVQFANAFSKSVACLFILSPSKTNLFIWLPWILVAACGISLRHVEPFIRHVDSLAWCGLSCSVTGEILAPRPGIEPAYSASQGRFLTTRPPGKFLSFHSLNCLSQTEHFWFLRNFYFI